MREFKDQVGFLTIAQNSDVDYLELAYVQASNIKSVMPTAKYAVIVDDITLTKVTDLQRQVFDYVIQLPVDLAKDDAWKLANEWQVFNLTPFKETIKLESDILFTRDIKHWLPALRLKDICFSYNCKDHQGNRISKTPYRKLFDYNQLPDIYNGMYYFRFSQTSANFFRVAKDIYTNWTTVKQELLHCNEPATTDVVFAVAAKIIGVEECTIPTLDFFNFVHMKPMVQAWSDQQPWLDHVNVESDGNMLRINNLNQYYPVHYYDKSFRP